jgi:hypothetical protein
MRSLPLRRLTLLTLMMQIVSGPVQAVPSASIRWGTCPAFQGVHRYDPTSTGETITVTSTGLAGAIQNFRVTIWISAVGSQVPDAWRFDPGGCQDGRLALSQSASASCPALRGTRAVEFPRVDYLTYPPGGWVWARESIQYGVAFDPIVADPTKTYTLARLDIDHSDAILGGLRVAGNCNCLERPLCISLYQVAYEDGNGVEHQVPLDFEGIHWNDPFNFLSCPGGPDLCAPACVWGPDTTCVASNPTPAAWRSWGRVKAGYR